VSPKSIVRMNLRKATAYLALGLFLHAGYAIAQTAALERNFSASQTEIESKLRDLGAFSGGKLPVLQGFVNAQGALERYHRGFYQFTVNVVSVGDYQTKVRVSASITAWYKGDAPSSSGYRVLPSNGRLESDLLDNLADELKVNNSPEPTQPSVGVDTKASAPESPSTAHSSSVFKSPRGISPPPPGTPSTSNPKDAATEKRIQELTEQGNTLREILRNQTRPDNLAVIKAPHTALLERPVEGSKVVLLADAEDEFQIVDTTADWVHVQVSGIARGWVRRGQVDVPQAVSGSLGTLENDPRTFEQPSFHETREEVSLFPGKWQPLDGKKVKIIWVAPQDSKAFGNAPRLNLVKSVFRKAYPDVSEKTDVAGVVVILDSEDGGMAATTLASLQQWQAGHLPDKSFWKRCWLDPAEAFKFEE
jgi:hypothetical protein